jgi:hypothetical protein
MLRNTGTQKQEPATSGTARNNQFAQTTVPELRAIDAKYMSWSDTVHYQKRPIIASGCQGEFVYE